MDPQNSNIDKLIRQTEQKWLLELCKACEAQFSDCHLPSHDHLHHERVWNNARHLLQILAKHGYPPNESEIEQLIIAAFFHDQGMSLSTAKDHGKLSRTLCKSYFTRAKETPVHFENILDAVEHHDNKEYEAENKLAAPINIRQLLNIADDMDAFGLMGVYRYVEIYLMRGKQPHELHDTIVPNLTNRFKHFSQVFEFDRPFIKLQNLRFIAARNFFKDLNFQLKQLGYSPEYMYGPVGVINLIRTQILENKSGIEETCKWVEKGNFDFYITNFFEKVGKEPVGLPELSI